MGACRKMSGRRGALWMWRGRSCRGRKNIRFDRGMGETPMLPSLLQLIQSAGGGGEAFVLNQALIDDAAEVGAVGAVTFGQGAVGNVGDAHRLCGAAEHQLDRIVEALGVADAAAPATD